MSDTKHGWVTPRADGARARCGGPDVCGTCQTEQMHETMLNGAFGRPVATAAEPKPETAGSAQDWRDIASAPKDGTPVLLFARHIYAESSTRVVGAYLLDHGWLAQSYAGQGSARLDPSHWMALPPFPGTQPHDRAQNAPRPSWLDGGDDAVAMAREDGLLPAAPAAGDALDAARLDWLEQHDGRFYNKDRISSVVGVGFIVAGDLTGMRHQSVRAAIDAAIAQQRGEA